MSFCLWQEQVFSMFCILILYLACRFLTYGWHSIPAGQLLTDILAQAATIVVDKGPVIPSRSCGQGPIFQGELLGTPRPLPQVEKTFTRRCALGRVGEDWPEVAGELHVVIQRRISFFPHDVSPLQSSP